MALHFEAPGGIRVLLIKKGSTWEAHLCDIRQVGRSIPAGWKKTDPRIQELHDQHKQVGDDVEDVKIAMRRHLQELGYGGKAVEFKTAEGKRA